MSLILPITAVIADDHEFYRNGFKNIIELRYPGEIKIIQDVCNGKQLVEAVKQHQPDVVFTDIQMPIMDGITACKIIKQQYPYIPVIALSMFTDINHIISMLKAGADGYLVKTGEHPEIIEAAKTVSRHQTYYCSTVSEKLYGVVANSNQTRKKNKIVHFGEQEKRVIKLICQQLSTKEIASEMKLSTRSVENYRRNIQEKIGARNVVGIALYAFFHELVNFSEINGQSFSF